MKTASETYSTAITDAKNYTGWIIDEFLPFFGRAVLEVGLGHGGYRAQLPEGLSYVGMDIDPNAVGSARKQYDTGRYFCADISDDNLHENLRGALVDSVLCVNVLEHIEDDVLAVSNMLNTLSGGGHLLLFVPAFNLLRNDLDRLAGHHRRYRQRDLAAIVAPLEAEIVVSKYLNPLGGLGWLVNGFRRYDSLQDTVINKQIEIFDRFILPISRLLNPVCARWFGQSLLCVVRKL